jgi:hypothetical protein
MPGFILPVPAASGKAQRNGIKTGNKTGIGENTVEINE